MTRLGRACPLAFPPPPAVAELLDALDDSDWQRRLPQLAERLADMGPSHAARLKARPPAARGHMHREGGTLGCVGRTPRHCPGRQQRQLVHQLLHPQWHAAGATPQPLPSLHPHPLHPQLLRKLPVQRARGLALQQFAGALLLERLLPSGHKLAGKSAVNRRDPSALDPAAVIAAQPWWVAGGGCGGQRPG